MEEIRDGFTRVTQPLSLYSDFSKVPPDVLAKACERGTKVHRLAELHVLGEWFPDPSDDSLGYLNSFRRWYNSMIDELISSEHRFYDESLKLTGAVDLVAVLVGDSKPSIIDIKTGSVPSSCWSLQLAAYQYLHNHHEGVKHCAERRIALKLDKDGGVPKILEYTQHNRDLDLYFSALKLWRFFNG